MHVDLMVNAAWHVYFVSLLLRLLNAPAEWEIRFAAERVWCEWQLGQRGVYLICKCEFFLSISRLAVSKMQPAHALGWIHLLDLRHAWFFAHWEMCVCSPDGRRQTPMLLTCWPIPPEKRDDMCTPRNFNAPFHYQCKNFADYFIFYWLLTVHKFA